MNQDFISFLLDSPIAYHRSFVHLGGVTGAVMLSQAVYWSKRTQDSEGWFWKTQVEWEEETGLTRREQETARKRLIDAGVLIEKRAGNPAKLFFKIDFDVLLIRLKEVSNKTGDKRQSKMAQSDNLVCTNQPIKNGAISHTLHTKNTTETTSKTTTEKREYLELITLFNEKFDKNYQLTKGRIIKIKNRLKIYSPHELKKAIENLSMSPWHRGINDRGWSADPDFLFRNDEQVDKWLNYQPDQARDLARRSANVGKKPTVGYINTNE